MIVETHFSPTSMDVFTPTTAIFPPAVPIHHQTYQGSHNDSNSSNAPTAPSAAVVATTTTMGSTSVRHEHPHHNRFPEIPTPEQRLRLIFEELDVDDNHKVTREGFLKVLLALNIGLSEAAIDDLFNRADVNHNGVITFQEYLNWAANYPMLIECLYKRARELVEWSHRETIMEQLSNELESAREVESEGKKAYNLALENTRQRKENLREAEEAKARIMDLYNRHSRDLLQEDEVLQGATAALTVKQSEMAVIRERFRLAKGDASSAARDVSVAEKQRDAVAEKLQRARQVHEKLLQQLRASEVSIEQLSRECEEKSIECDTLADTRARVIESLRTDERALEEGVRVVAVSEREVMGLRRAHDNVQKRVHDSHFHLREIDSRVAVLKKQVETSLKEEADARKHHCDMLQKLEETMSKYRSLEETQNARTRRALETEAEELFLVEEEIRLRDQRLDLDVRDDVYGQYKRQFSRHVHSMILSNKKDSNSTSNSSSQYISNNTDAMFSSSPSVSRRGTTPMSSARRGYHDHIDRHLDQSRQDHHLNQQNESKHYHSQTDVMRQNHRSRDYENQFHLRNKSTSVANSRATAENHRGVDNSETKPTLSTPLYNYPDYHHSEREHNYLNDVRSATAAEVDAERRHIARQETKIRDKISKDKNHHHRHYEANFKTMQPIKVTEPAVRSFLPSSPSSSQRQQPQQNDQLRPAITTEHQEMKYRSLQGLQASLNIYPSDTLQ